MYRVSLASAVAIYLATGAAAHALTINLTLDSDLIASPGQVVYTLGLEDAADGTLESINGYTLGYTFDASELSFVSATQLVSFGALGQLPFTAPNDCSALIGRCTAGNVPNFDSSPVGPLFSLTFDIIANIDDSLDDFTAGILSSAFEDVTQPTGDAVFDQGIVVASHTVVPEPSVALLVGSGVLVLAALRRLQ